MRAVELSFYTSELAFNLIRRESSEISGVDDLIMPVFHIFTI